MKLKPVTVKFLLLNFLMLAALQLSAQKGGRARIDSLLKVLPAAKPDTSKVNLLLDISRSYNANDTTAAPFEYARQAKLLSEKIKWQKGVTLSLMESAYRYFLKSDLGNSQKYLDEAYNLALKGGGGDLVSSVQGLNMAIIAFKRKDPMPYLMTCVELAKKRNDEKNLRGLYGLIGQLYKARSNYSLALEYYQKAIMIGETVKGERPRGMELYFVGALYSFLGKYANAISYYKKAAGLLPGTNDEILLSSVYQGIADCAEKTNDHNTAIEYYGKAKLIGKQKEDQKVLYGAENGIGQVYYAKRDYGKAYDHVKLALSLAKADSVSFLNSLTTMAAIYRDAPDSVIARAGIALADRYKISATMLNRVLNFGDYGMGSTFRLPALKELSLTYEKMGNYTDAYKTYKTYITRQAKRDSAQNEKAFIQKEAQLNFSRKEDSLKFQQNITAGQLKQQSLLATQQRQSLLLKEQELGLANKQKDIEKLNYLKTQADLEAEQNKRKVNEQQLQTSQKEQALAQTTLQLQKTEITSKRMQSYFFIGGLVALLVLLLFIALNYYNQRKSNKLLAEANTQITAANLELNEQREEITTQRDRLVETVGNLKTAQTQLVQAEKMASLGELTAGIAHEIQNPLNFVNNFSEVNREMITELKEALEAGDIAEALAIATDIEQNETKIHHHGKRADGIVKGMLEHSRASTGTKEPTDLNKLADEYLKLAYHGLRAKDKTFNAELITHFDESLPLVNVIPQDMGRVLLNLFNNAFYAVHEKAKTAASGFKPTVTIKTFTSPSGGWGASVHDNGTGIPDSIKEKIMQPFFTTKPTGQGTGLGLSLSYDIVVKGHGGKINVESTPGDGSEFSILLPVS